MRLLTAKRPGENLIKKNGDGLKPIAIFKKDCFLILFQVVNELGQF